MRLKFLFAAALSLSCGSAALAQNDDAARDKMINDLLGHLEACQNATGDTLISTCEASMDKVIAVQPTINFVHELMLSYFVEASVRFDLAEAYLKPPTTNLPKHCENVEKLWATASYAKEYEQHPSYADIRALADTKKKAVGACRQMGGTPPWGAPL